MFSKTDNELNRTNTRFHQLLLEKTENSIKFLNAYNIPFIKKHNLLAGHEVYYLNREPIVGTRRKGISTDITKAVYINYTAIIDFCLQLALYMGFSEVYLLGCDCNHLDKQINSASTHFHTSYPKFSRSPNTDYQKGGVSWLDNVVKSYSMTKEVFERHGREIYNAGIGGKLEVFERVNYDDLF